MTLLVAPVVACRSVINQEAFNNWSESSNDTGPPSVVAGPASDAGVDRESFMAAMEADCRERAARRQHNEAAADKLRLEGNASFQAGNFVSAVELYTEAMTHVRYSTKLYTNRAQAHLRLDQFEVSTACATCAALLMQRCTR